MRRLVSGTLSQRCHLGGRHYAPTPWPTSPGGQGVVVQALLSWCRQDL